MSSKLDALFSLVQVLNFKLGLETYWLIAVSVAWLLRKSWFDLIASCSDICVDLIMKSSFIS